MRVCTYSSGDVLQVPDGVLCPDPRDPDDPTNALVDWSDTVDVITDPPVSAAVVVGVLIVLAILAKKK